MTAITDAVAVAYGSALTSEQVHRAEQLEDWLGALIDQAAASQRVAVDDRLREMVLVSAIAEALASPVAWTASIVQIDDATVRTEQRSRGLRSLLADKWDLLGLYDPARMEAFTITPYYARRPR